MPRLAGGRAVLAAGGVGWQERRRGAGDAAWAWLLNVQHTYLANRCIDLGKGAPEIHGSWSLLNNLQDWRWTCR